MGLGFRRINKVKQCVSDETRGFMEEQYAECTTFEDVALLYSDFERISSELMKSRHKDLIEGIKEN